MTATSPLGFVAKDNGFSNLGVNNNIDTKTLSLQTLNVTNLNVTNTFTTTNTQTITNVHNLTVLNNLQVDNQLLFVNPIPANQIVFENANTMASITLNCQPISTHGITYTIPDLGANANFILSSGDQTILGVKTFLQTVTFSPSTPLTFIAIGGNHFNPVATFAAPIEFNSIGSFPSLLFGTGPQIEIV